MTALYTDGTITLVNGSPIITGIDTAWKVSNIVGGTVFAEVDGGSPLPILPNDGDAANLHPISDTQMTAAIKWTGPSGTYKYAIVRETSYNRQQAVNAEKLGDLLSQLDAPLLAALSSVEGLQDHLILLTGPSTLSLIPRASLLEGVKRDETVNTLAGLATYSGEVKGFAVLVANAGGGRAAIYVKRSNADGDWSEPVYITGAEGDTGNPGPYTTIQIGDITTLNPGQDATITQTQVSPGVVRWDFGIPKGLDGEGTGDVVGPAAAVANRVAVFADTTGKVLKDGGFILGNAASRNVGNTAGTVAAGDDPRFAAGGSSQNEALLALAIADLQGKALGMKGGVADAFDDNSGVVPPQGGLDGNTVALLHFDGANNSTAIVDSVGNRVWSAVGDAKISNAYSVFGGTSLFLDGAGDYIQTTDLSGLAFGTGDFCIELRMRLTTVPTTFFIVDMRSADGQSAPCLYVNSGKLMYYVVTTNRIVGGTTLVANTDYHVVVERTAGVTKLFLNGVQEGASWADATNYAANGFKIGTGWSIGSFLNGYVDEFRISNVGRWSENFAVPTAAYYADISNSYNYVYDAANDWFSPISAAASFRFTGSTPSGLVNTPANINDNNPATSGSWTGADLTSANINARKLAQLDLGSVQTINKIEAVGHYSSVGANNGGGLYYSVDGTNWTQLGANIALNTTSTTFTSTGSVSARYVALVLMAANFTSATVYLGDLNAYGPPAAPAYSNPGGSGDRSASIAVTTAGFTFGGGNVQNLVNGLTADNSLYFSGGSGQTGYIQFDFGAGNAKYIDQFSFYQVASWAGTGPWSWSGSNDGVNFTTLLASFSLQGGNPAIIDIPPHATAYRYFRISGNNAAFGGGYLNEINFRITTTPPSTQNMSLVSIPYQLAISPVTGRVTVQTVEFESGVPNVDFAVDLSRDGGANYKTANLSAIAGLAVGNVKMYEDTAFSFASLPAGSNLKWRFRTLTNKNIGLSGIVAQGGS